MTATSFDGRQTPAEQARDESHILGALSALALLARLSALPMSAWIDGTTAIEAKKHLWNARVTQTLALRRDLLQRPELIARVITLATDLGERDARITSFIDLPSVPLN